MQDSFPGDLAVSATSGSLLPGEENQIVEIRANGQGRYSQYQPDQPDVPPEEIDFTVSDTELGALWTAIQEVDFFSLEARYEGSHVDDGSFAILTVTAQRRTYRVEAQNAPVPGLENLLRVINRITPDDKDLRYSVITGI